MLLIKITPDKCDYCGTCVGVCPEDAIELTDSTIDIDEALCTNCSKCVWVCPIDVLIFDKNKLKDKE